jgi:hypothetical protein
VWASTLVFASPDFKAILRAADPAVAAETRRAALDAPEVAEVIAEIREDNEVTLPAAAVTAAAPRAVAVAVVDASPWAVAGEIDKAALPSSLAPNAAPPVVRDAIPVMPKAQKTATRKFPGWASSVAAVIAVVGPCTFAVVLLSRPTQNGGVTVPSASAGAGVSSFAPPVMASAAPVSMQAPSVPAVESAVSDAGAAPPVVVPSAAIAPSARPLLRPAPAPVASVPEPPVAVAPLPVVTATPSAAPPAIPPTHQPPTPEPPPDAFLHKRPQ